MMKHCLHSSASNLGLAELSKTAFEGTKKKNSAKIPGNCSVDFSCFRRNCDLAVRSKEVF
jgi:hypothetical protein